MPIRFTGNHDKMRHNRLIISSMPMRRPRRRPDSITSPNSLGFPSLVANPSAARQYMNHLPLDVSVPVRSSAWRECDTGNAGAFVEMHDVGQHLAGKGGCGLSDLGALVGNNCRFGHIGFFYALHALWLIEEWGKLILIG